MLTLKVARIKGKDGNEAELRARQTVMTWKMPVERPMMILRARPNHPSNGSIGKATATDLESEVGWLPTNFGSTSAATGEPQEFISKPHR